MCGLPVSVSLLLALVLRPWRKHERSWYTVRGRRSTGMRTEGRRRLGLSGLWSGNELQYI